MDYICVVTDYGKQQILSALAQGTTISITAIAYGDGGGAEYTPTANMTQLVNQVGRITTITKTIDSNWAYFTGTIPTAQASFTLRELGLYDSTNHLIAIANTPSAYKPSSVSGIAMSLPVSIGLALSDGEVLIVTATEEYATKTYVLEQIADIKQIDCGTF